MNGATSALLGRAVSVWGEQAAELAAVAGLGRDGSGTGTSILVVGFDEPVRDVEREIEEICEDLVDSATRWFWPALLDGDISILVEGWRDDVREFTRHAQPSNAEVAPFIHAREDSPEVSEVIENPGEVALREIRVRAPAQRPERFESPRQAVEAPATLRIRLAESGEDSYRNTVALQRGTGMVVAYRPVKTRTGADVAFHAVLLAGRANGDTEADQALEEFLRAAEPPAHAEWTHTTERIRAEYASGFRTSILDLFGQIEAAVRDLTREEVVESDEGPDALKRLFPMPGVGVPAREETHRLADARAELQHEHWVFGGRYIRKPREASERERDWRFQIALFLDQEGSGAGSARGDRVAIGELEVEEPARVCEPNADGTVDVVVPAGTDRVRFWGLSDPVSALPPGGLRRVRLRMDLRTLRAEVAL
jgi:RNA polymerase primary sigma factor